MSRKKIAIIVLVVSIVLVAIVSLVLKARIGSEAVVLIPEKTPILENLNISSTSDESVLVSPVAQPLSVADLSLKALPNAPEAPKKELVNNNDIPAAAIRLDISSDGFSPKEFRIKAGAEVVLALAATDGNAHVFIFPNASLMGLTTMVLAGETKIITFTAPAAGSFSFRDDIPGFRENIGTMIVE
ncbi:MAG: cupredoxin domain-containing protein [Patescibacteria group bacterium]|jgi:hypothetical protein